MHSVDTTFETAVRPRPACLPSRLTAASQKHFATGETLFEPGEPRRLYRVERGALCHFIRPAAGEHEVIEFAFPGEIVGLGYSTTHVSTARAMIDTVVTCISEAEFDSALRNDDKLFFKLADAGEREFDYFRHRSLEGDLLQPLERVASYLLAIASINAAEGRQPTVVPDDYSSGFVADQLQLSIDTLATVLLSLQRRGYVDTCASGLRILDVAGLEKLAAKA